MCSGWCLCGVFRLVTCRLQELHVAFNEVTREAAVELVEAAVRESLSLLQLDGNQLGERGISAVREAAAAARIADTLGGFRCAPTRHHTCMLRPEITTEHTVFALMFVTL